MRSIGPLRDIVSRLLNHRDPLATARGRLPIWRRTGLVLAAWVRRFWLARVTFIGVTGSAGKTSAKELIVAVLSRRMRGSGNPKTRNLLEHVADTVLRTPGSDEFRVVEISADPPGTMARALQLTRPRVGVITTIGDDHRGAFKSRQAIADEKGRLVAALPADGTAVLNADDPLVLGMRGRCAGRIVTYGLAPESDVRAEDVSGAWPERLRMTVVVGAERAQLQTQLCGTHWTPSVLAAVATGVSLGVPLNECVAAIAAAPPQIARMQPAEDGHGVTFIRDDWKAPLWTVDPCFEFMRQARATRKVIVVGTVSDFQGTTSAQFARLARRALEIAEHVVFVGPWAAGALRARDDDSRGELRAFSNVRLASEYLNATLRPGDLVLLKGTNPRDHLVRLLIARRGEVRCWRDDCSLPSFCTRCPKLLVPSGPAAATTAGASTSQTEARAGLGMPVVVGLGNPGTRFAGTPHNVGHEVLERLSARVGAVWERHDLGCVARGQWRSRPVCLLRLDTPMNRSGTILRAFAARLDFGAADCILVHDDLDLPPGSVRVRMRGSAGNHKGMASVLDAFETDVVCRVKVGIGRPDRKDSVAAYVLQPFPEAVRPAVDRGCDVAVDRLLDLIAARSRPAPEEA